MEHNIFKKKNYKMSIVHSCNNIEESNIHDIIQGIKESPYHSWIKSINIENTILIGDYNRLSYFKKVADVVLDNDVQESGEKKRNTDIKFVPNILDTLFKEKKEWLYLFTINGHIVKIGGTRTGLHNRCASYLCGHHIPERNKSGSCSKTNAFIYNSFHYYAEHGCKIEMYGYELPKEFVSVHFFDRYTRNIPVQTYHAYESVFINDFRETYGNKPDFCVNSDPDYQHKSS